MPPLVEDREEGKAVTKTVIAMKDQISIKPMLC